MKSTILIKSLARPGEEKRLPFATERAAKQYFKNFCDDHGLEYFEESDEAGGLPESEIFIQIIEDENSDSD